MLGGLGSVQKKGRKLTTEHMQCPGSYTVLPSCWIHGARKQLQLQLQLLREALGELVLPEVFRPVPFLGQYSRLW